MARRYGRLNKYDSKIHRCAVSGLRFYEAKMVRVAEGKYVYHEYIDEDYHKRKRGHGQALTPDDLAYRRNYGRSLILTRPQGLPLTARSAARVGYRLMRGSAY